MGLSVSKSGKTISCIKALVELAKEQDDNYFKICEVIACIFPCEIKEQLTQLVNGPIYDGDVISKSDRGVLFDLGLAVRVCFKGEQGYTGANYTAYTINKNFK